MRQKSVPISKALDSASLAFERRGALAGGGYFLSSMVFPPLRLEIRLSSLVSSSEASKVLKLNRQASSEASLTESAAFLKSFQGMPCGLRDDWKLPSER